MKMMTAQHRDHADTRGNHADPRRDAHLIEERVRDLVTDIAERHHLVIEDVDYHPRARRLAITIDYAEGTEPVGSAVVHDVTRAISTALDDTDPIAEAYTLEVSTPGAERALTCARHFARTVGRLVEVATGEGDTIVGRLVDVSDATVTIAVAGVRGRPGRSVTVNIDSIESAHSRVDFSTCGG